MFISEDNWLSFLRQLDSECVLHDKFFFDCLEHFGKLNIFAIVGGANLIDKDWQGRSQIVDQSALFKCAKKTQLEHHTDRVRDFTTLPEHEQGRMLSRAQAISVIINLLKGAHTGFSIDKYIQTMDEYGLWDVQLQAGAEEDAEFEHDYPIPPALMLRIEQELHNPGPARGCYHCSSFEHRARQCPRSGSWRQNQQGRLVRFGGRPKCFVCGNNSPNHQSQDCPFRHPHSYDAIISCNNCWASLHGQQQFRSSCPRCKQPLRCWNCGHPSHRLNQCTEPRYQPPTNNTTRPREERGRD